ncbi:MAG TPA: hypothetical protein VGY48_15890 [Vicinamibacterales bacterium]|jgi:hypothetical protein|nr:hypothetical protein [Vicinamibacterales bacterium]
MNKIAATLAFFSLTVSCSSGTYHDSHAGVQQTTAALTVADVTSLSLLDASTLQDGDLAYVDTLKSHFSLEPSAQALVSYVRITAFNRPGYEWLRYGTSPAWWSEANWWIDPVAGNDEAVGTSSSAPLQTNAEFGRRMYTREPAATDPTLITINYVNDVPDGDALTYVGGPNLAGTNINLIAQCATVVLASGTIDTALQRVPDSNQGNTITVPGISSWTPYIGKLIRLQGTPTTSAIIEADLGSGQALLSEQYVNGIEGPGFVVGQTIEVFQGTRLPDAEVDGPNVAVNFRTCLVQTIGTTRMNLSSNAVNGTMSFTQSEIRDTSGSYTYLNAYSANLNGSSVMGKVYVQTALSGVSASFINSWLFVEGGVWYDHWDSFGAWNTTINVGDGGVIRMHNDFHSGGLPAGKPQFYMYTNTDVYWAYRWYGQGNDPTSIGMQFQQLSSFLFSHVPTCNVGIPFQTSEWGIGFVNRTWADMPYGPDEHQIYVHADAE